MKPFFLFLVCLISSFWFSQQTEEFKMVKSYYNNHRILLNNEFKKKYDAETDVLHKDAIKRDFLFFMRKMDSVENVALIGALLKVKNLEDLKKIKNKEFSAPQILPKTNKEAEYPGGINALRQQVANLFYSDGVHSDISPVKTNVAFIVEKDGSISNVHANGDNFSFNRQAEIALYSIPEKFSPASFNGNPVRYCFKLPLTMSIE